MYQASIESSTSLQPLRAAPSRSGRQGQAESQWRKGVKALDAGRWADALRHFERAVRLDPDDAVFWLNLAQAHRKLGDLPAAEAAARQSLALDPRHTLACQMLGKVLSEQRQYAEAIKVFASFPPDAPKGHEFHCEWGRALHAEGQYSEAAGQFIESFASKPDYVQAHLNLAFAFTKMGMHEQAAECARTAAALSPNNANALSALVHSSQHACRWVSINEDILMLRQATLQREHVPASPFAYLMVDSEPAEQLRIARLSAADAFGHIESLPRTAGLRLDPLRRIRIGYISADFRYHATSMLMAELLELHDRKRFEVFLYSTGKSDKSYLTKRVELSSEHWIDASEMSDHALANRIRSDQIDIAVDLNGHTNNNRLAVFARRPSPIQVSWLGYPGTTGADFIDYIIGDPIVTPAESQEHFSECIAQMPWSYQPNDRKRPALVCPPRSELGLPEEGFVFCSFNNNYKITPEIYDRWCRLLLKVPGSVLWLLESNVQASSNLIREAQARGVDGKRVIFAPLLPQALHLARIQAADLFLDSLPYNAHTTASDALWQGLPVVTCVGDAFAGRVAASLLRATGCEELITRSLDEYESLALSLAQNPDHLEAVRVKLAEARRSAPLFDTERFAHDLEALYERMMTRHRSGLGPGLILANQTVA